MYVVRTSIHHNNFHIREGLRFTKPPQFLVGMGILQQRWITTQAYERYKDCCENLFFRINVARHRPVPRDVMEEQCFELVEEACQNWEHRMQNWNEDNLGITESVLMEIEGRPIRR